MIVALTASLMLGCPDKSRQQRQIAGKPALELRKAVSFALATPALPGTRDELVAAISDGMRGHVKLSDDHEPVVAEGDGYPTMRRLTVDLTDAALDTGHKPAKLNSREKSAAGVHADRFEFRAEPLKVDGGSIHLNVHARDVDFGTVHDRDGRPVLSLDNARDGQVFCQTTMSDLGTIFRASANERGKPFGLSVQKAKLQLTSHNERDVSADLRLASRLILIPIQLHFTAHVTVDRNGNAHLSGLTCEGDDAAGTLITQFIRPALKDYDDKTMPLVGFPSPKIRLHDVTVHVEGETVRLAAAFGS